MYVGVERRQHPRYDADSMNAGISFQDKESGKVRFEKVQAVDFSVSGVAIKTNIALEPGEMVTINISKDRFHASNLIAMVRNVINLESKNRYGLEFDFTANDYMASEQLEQTLANIEHALKKSHKYMHRNPYRKITDQ
jgi:hypothetical protein